MVARINSSKSIQKALNYNEQKVRQGRAECLAAFQFLKEVNELSFYDKLHCFERHHEMNDRVQTNTLHISLNFHPSEQLSNEKMAQIAAAYMEKIGFGMQPFLIYRHYDAGHPHLHIVSTNISLDGSRMSLHNLGKHQSEKARRELEVLFGLVAAQGKKEQVTNLHPLEGGKVVYGRSAAKRAIAGILGRVLTLYKYTSLPELNAVLSQYNVVAERGSENSRMYKAGGLIYRALDDKGKGIGAPIKASAFHGKPTLAYLQQQFGKNAAEKKSYAQPLKTKIAWAIRKGKLADLDGLRQALQKEGIAVVLRQNSEGVIYGITYVDHKAKSVCNGSDLGKEFSAKAIQERYVYPALKVGNIVADEKKKVPAVEKQARLFEASLPKKDSTKILEAVLTPETAPVYLPPGLKKSKKKKRKNRSTS